MLKILSCTISLFFCLIPVWAADLPPKPKLILFLGDSLPEGVGVEKQQSFPYLLERKIDEFKPGKWKVIVGGIGGSTSASAPARMRWHLKAKPDLVVLALGANDGLRGLPVANLSENLKKTISIAKQQKVTVIIAGMQMPSNYGERYTKDFRQSFLEIAKQEKIALIPFLLEGVGGVKEMNTNDGIHPNEKGHKRISENVWTVLSSYL